MIQPSPRRRFFVLLAWNSACGIFISLPLVWLLKEPLGNGTALLVSASFAGLMLLMGAILAAYFAFLRT